MVPFFAATVYILLLVGVNTPLADADGLWIPLVLILGTIVAFGLGAMLGSDFGRIRILELELARTVAVHSGAGQVPESDSPLGRVLKSYSSSADEMHRHARVHAYASGPALWGAAAALASAFFWGLSFTTGAIWLNYLAIVVALPAVVLLIFSVTVLALGIGVDVPLEGFDVLTPRRWRRFEGRSDVLDEAVASLPWLAEPRKSVPAVTTPDRSSTWKEDAQPA